MPKRLQSARAGRIAKPPAALPEIPRHEELHLAMQQCARTISQRFLDFCGFAAEFTREGYWARYACETPEDYYTRYTGISYRTVRAWCAVLEGLGRLPVKDQPAARETLVGLGSHKARVLAPILGREGEDWHAWADRAATVTEERLQEEVSAACGHRPRGAPDQPGERWYRALLAPLPPELQEDTQRAFRLAHKEAATANPIGCWKAIIAEFLSTWEPQAGR